MRATSLKCAFVLMSATAVSFYLAGCNIVGPAIYLIEGPPKVDAQYVLNDVPTLVFIDDRRNVVNPISLRKVIADRTSGDLMEKELVKMTISSQDAMSLATQRERNNHVLSIEEIGKAMGARQVIYVEMMQFTDTPDGFTPRPASTCRVRVIDVEQKVRLFPPADAEVPYRVLNAMIREVDPSMYSSRSGRLQVFEALAQETGSAIGKLFYSHEARPLGGNLNPR